LLWEAGKLGDPFDAAGDYYGYDTETDTAENIEIAPNADISEDVSEGIADLQNEANALDVELLEEAGSANEEVNPEDLDYQELYNTAVTGLDEYDFNGINLNANAEDLQESIIEFEQENWDTLSTDERKDAVENLSAYLQDEIGLKNPPQIEFYNNEKDGEYGAYEPQANTLSINECMLDDSKEAAKTVAHELWHTYQHECANDPHSLKDYQYQMGVNSDVYVSPKDDYDGYKNQLVEAEAFAFENQIQNALDQIKGRG
jgi:hypothetical protein